MSEETKKIQVKDSIDCAIKFHKKSKARISTTDLELDGCHVIIVVESISKGSK